MSSTNRGTERNKSDYYQTPENVVREIFSYLIDNTNVFKNITTILDPCAGGNSQDSERFPMAYVNVLSNYGFEIDSIDIRDDSLAKIKTDFLNFNTDKTYDMIISNPPFSHAIEFIDKGLELLKDGGYLIYLLRLNFFGSQLRKPFWDKYMPEYTIVHHNRISFTGGATDSIEYAHFVFRKGYHPEYTKLKVI